MAPASFRCRDGSPAGIVTAQRLFVPVTVHGPHREYVPGDWIVFCTLPAPAFVFVPDRAFRAKYAPTDAAAAALMARTDFGRVVDEQHPSIPQARMLEGRMYAVITRGKAARFSPDTFCGELVQRTERTVRLRNFGLRVEYDLPIVTISLVLPLDPESEPCLLSSKALTVAGSRPRQSD